MRLEGSTACAEPPAWPCSAGARVTSSHPSPTGICCGCLQARPFARLAGQDLELLGITVGLMERAVQLQPSNVNYVSVCSLVRGLQAVANTDS